MQEAHVGKPSQEARGLRDRPHRRRTPTSPLVHPEAELRPGPGAPAPASSPWSRNTRPPRCQRRFQFPRTGFGPSGGAIAATSAQLGNDTSRSGRTPFASARSSMRCEIVDTRSNRRIRLRSQVATIHAPLNPEGGRARTPSPPHSPARAAKLGRRRGAPLSTQWGRRTERGSTIHTTSGRQGHCRSITGKLDVAKLARSSSRLRPPGSAGTHTGQRQTRAPCQRSVS